MQLCLEEGFPVEQVAREMGVGRSTVSKWVPVYLTQGEAGLQAKPTRRGRPRPKVGPAVHTQRQIETARRLAVETWLQSNGVITITQNENVLPIFLKQIAHN